MRRRAPSRGLIFGAIVLTMVIGAVAYVAWAALSTSDEPEAAGPAIDVTQRKRVSAIRSQPYVVFQNGRGEAGGAAKGHVGLAALDRPRHGRVSTGAVCDRLYFAVNRGLCMHTVTLRRIADLVVGQPGYKIQITGPDFEPRHELELRGIPSRARISPDGRYGATTVFISGHSYLDDGYSTQTVLIDMARGKILADLEKDFTVTRDGRRIKEIDFNFWGVTFARRPGHFYATLGTGGKTYLIEGDLRTRRVRVLHEGVECPSISPDNTRLAYKKRIGDGWRLNVLDLATMRSTPLAEERSVDDQVEWLDDGHILYGLSHDTWVVRADGTGKPRRFMPDALSPAVVRS
jgi:hypothetical protein